MASDVEKELKEEEKELKAEKPETEEVEETKEPKVKKSKENPPAGGEMQMEAPKRENPHLRARPILIFWAVVVVLFTAVIFFVIGMNYGDDNRSLSDDINTATLSVSSTPTVGATATQVPSSTQFAHSILKYSFDIPQEYIVVDNYGCEGGCASVLEVAKKESDVYASKSSIALTFYNEQNNQQLTQNIQGEYINDILSESGITIDGQTGKKYEIGGMSAGNVYAASKGNQSIKIVQYPSDEASQKIVDGIISSFKFPN